MAVARALIVVAFLGFCAFANGNFIPNNVHKKLKAGWTCETCRLVVELIQQGIEEKRSEDDIAWLIKVVCIDLDIEDQTICNEIVDVYRVEVFTVAFNISLNQDLVCGTIIGSSCGTPYHIANWTVTLPDIHKPPVVPPVPPQPGSPTIRVLQLTDIHLDMRYREGANADCGEPLCCRDLNGPPAPGVPGAGKWGDYRACDTPMITLENLFLTLTKMQDEFDYILWTGDIASHAIWNQTREEQLEMIRIIQGMFQKYLPTKQVYPIVGNHESCPMDSFPPSFIRGNKSIDWLYNPLAESWLTWLPAETNKTLRRGGFYTTSPFPGFRIVGINDNYGSRYNWWLLLNQTDPNDHLAWLIDVLQEAESKNEKVHIVGHIPTDLLMKGWSWAYFKIINRYESTVAAQFFGHTHTDEFRVFYDSANFTRPTSVAYVSPALTTWAKQNTGFRIYTIDGNYSGSSWAVLDHETYILNISRANQGNAPVWEKEYTAKEAYGMKGLYPADWGDLINRMKTDDNLFNSFYYNFKKGYVHDGECKDASCRKNMLCSLKMSRSYDHAHLCPDLEIKQEEYEEFLKTYSFN